jgi:hypothetical protein
MAINAKLDADTKALKADGDAFTAMLKTQAEKVGLTTKELREYNAEQLRTKAAQLGLMQAGSESKDKIDGYINTIKNAKGPHESFNLLTAGSARELMVLTHELSQGQFQRFGGSLIVLAERINFLPSVLEKAGAFAASLGVSLGVLVAAVAAVVAVVGTAIWTFTKSGTALKEMRNEVILTGHSIGVTGDQLYDMANKIGEATGKFGAAREAVIQLASTGKFTADQIKLITEAAVGLEKYGGVAIDNTIKQFEKLAAEPIKGAQRGFKGVSEAAMELDKQLHFLTPQMLDEIIHLERIGDAAGASKKAIGSLAEEEKKRVQELKNNLTPIGVLFDTIAEKASKMWNNVFHKKSLTEQLEDAKDNLAQIQGVNGVHPEQTHQANAIAEVARLEKKIRDQAEKEKQEQHNKEVARTAELALIHRRTLLDMGKDEDTLTAQTARDAADRAAIKAAGLKSELFSAEADAEAMAIIEKKYKQKVTPTPGLGMSKVNSRIAELQMEFEKASYFADKEMKLEQDKAKHHEVSALKLYNDQQKYFNDRQKLIDDTEAKEIAATNLYDHGAKNKDKLAEEAATKRFEIEKRYDMLRGKLAADRDAADTALERANKTAEDNREEMYVKGTQTINAETKALQDKIAGYNLIPEAIRKAGISEKQMQDYFTQAEIDNIQERIDALKQFDGVDGTMMAAEIARLNARKNALDDKRKAQKAWEDVQAGNAAALNTPAAMKANAAEQVKLWKDAGNEIQKALTQAFGESGKAAGEMFKAFSEGQANQIDLTQKVAEANRRTDLSKIEQTQLITALQNQQEQNQLNMYGNMANAASQFFDHQSKGYKVMQTVSQAYHLAEMAQALASIPVKLAAGAATMFAQSGFGGFAGVAAMTALVAGFGVAISGGGSKPPSAADRQAAQGTGSILGDDKAKSDSIAHSISVLEKNSGLGLAQGNEMVGYLKNVSDNISSFAALVVRTTGITGNLADTTKGGAASFASSALGTTLIMGPITEILNKLSGGFIGNAIGKIANSIFGGNVHTIDTGFTLGKTSVADVMANGVNASQYTDTKTDGGWFHSDKYNTSLTSLGQQANDQFAKIIVGMSDTITAAAKTLGVCTDDFTAHLQSFVVDIGNISLKGLSGDEIQKQLQAVFSKLGDDMAQYGLSGFDKFQKVGEGYLETIARVANDFMQVKDVFAVLGKSLTAVGVDAANVSEGLISAAGSVEALTKNTKTFVDGFLTNAEKIAPIAKSVDAELAKWNLSWVQTREQFKQVVLGLDLTTEAGQKEYAALINLAGAFAQVHDAIVDTTMTAQQIADQRKSLQDQYDQLTMTSAQLHEKERNAIDDSNKALYDNIYLLTQQAQAIKDMQDGATTSLANVDNAFNVFQKAVDRQKTVLKNAFDVQMKQIDDKITLETNANQKLKALASSLQSTLDGMKPSVQAADVTRALRVQAQQQLRDALTLFKSGVVPDADSLKNPLSVAASDSTAMFSSAEDYQRDFYRTQNTISDLAKYSNDAASTSDKILQTLNDQKTAAQAAYDAEIKSLDDTVAKAQEQIDILKGQSTTLLSIDQALNALGLAISEANKNPLVSGQSAISQAYQTSLGRAPDQAGLDFWKNQITKGTPIEDILNAINNSPEAQVQKLYQSLFNRPADAGGLGFWTQQMNNGVDISAIKQAMMSSDEYHDLKNKIPSFDKGTNELPEDMLAMVHKGERIVPASDNLELMQRLKSPQSNAEALSNEVVNLREEIASLKETIRAGDVANVQTSKEIVKVLKRWDVDGQPETRDVSA